MSNKNRKQIQNMYDSPNKLGKFSCKIAGQHLQAVGVSDAVVIV